MDAESSSDALDRIRSAADRTLSTGTARVTYAWRGADLDRPAIEGAGVVDFVARRVDLGASIDLGGQRFFVWDGQWRGPVGEPAGPMPAGGPIWLVQILRGASSAAAAVADQLGDVPAERYEVVVDLVDAEAAAPESLAAPGGFSMQLLRAIPATVWLDGDGRLRRLELRLLADAISMALDDFGTPVTIAPPAGAVR